MDETTVLDLERAGWDALCDGTAAEFYGRTMTPGGLMVLANGQIMTRDQVVEALAASPSWASYEINEPRLVPLGVDSVALVYTARARRSPTDPPFVGAMTSVYVASPDGDGWRLALYQQTVVAS
ncbi:MAG: nuclear transport factor 2 family protein [Acidimicrobiales bacterium]